MRACPKLGLGLRLQSRLMNDQPTLRKPCVLFSCRHALQNEVLVVHRRDDSETVSAFNALLNLPDGSLLRFVAVDEPGFLPPIWQAAQIRQSDKLPKIARAM